MKKNTKIIIAVVVFITFVIGSMTIKNMNREFEGIVSSHWLYTDDNDSYWASINLKEGYSEENLNYLRSITTKNRKDELSSLESKKLGLPNHHMMVYVSDKSTKLTKDKLNFNLWIYEDKGYIQYIEDEYTTDTTPQLLNGISKLDNEEYEFITKALLKYYSPDTIFNK